VVIERKKAHALPQDIYFGRYNVHLYKPARYGNICFIKKTGGANGEVDVLEITFV
jgi:hypothetical protein